ncbi:NAD-dependent epimerase/dehydratase family protein [Ruminiclostridium cellobioparum]|uniref:NAD-dependent epimerase/dehydratase n=1 Tax=Ruminiclostridium cellobioparum subsp. termitidis CT1112 TaxID=1195236 RepID=S0FGA0_RUMCE|nr:NAD-dependent epimerase/dehydratase family protein [Ruminiclostridium cellobioparum]EMS70345.1 NAD-dependent epimerase/dehydratase [Ruminiclostridium cellobioparum subsp. termitidis CT1112]
MKKILITGADSYIGTSLEKWVTQWPNKYQVEIIDMKEPSWKYKNFFGYDVIFHVAGIAHVSADPKMEELYYKINRDLTIETAVKAKNEGVKQFIFMSSIIVYGDSSFINSSRVIDKNTIPKPANFYGKSKLEAEERISVLESSEFKIVILRPPMIYGKGSRGNYPRLANYAKRFPLFPDIENKRSMLYIDNLCEFIRLMIDNDEQGTFFPQNAEYVNTAEMVRLIADIHGKKVRLVKIFNLILKMLGRFFGVVNKAFGSLVYDMKLSEYKQNYRVRNFRDSIEITEK